MRIGLLLDERGMAFADLAGAVRDAAEGGLSAVWAGHHYSWDPLTSLAVAGREAPGIAVGTAIVPSFPVHPRALASQALTAAAALGPGRLTLGVGVSHQPIIEGQFGISFDRPARHLREYLSVLGPLLRGADAEYAGETLASAGPVPAPGAEAPSLLVAALGPVMLRIAGELADGTVTTWTGPVGLDAHIVPVLSAAAHAAGRPGPRVVAGVFAAVTGDPDGVRDRFGDAFAIAGELASYRAVLRREGASAPGDLLVAGDEAAVERALRRHLEAGATELAVSVFGTPEEQRRTMALLRALSA
ncbi:F420-dependent oxidoreductase-like protein [Murinocardiopsis flavida]|uniref:F420-dependent oxidoreductase-like protein n=1 Tax=Murinocardiopsis flavida TaxID=645275 RepID=A0A2P8DR03_9ACTN|nr:TIGR03564 family F420-dependent LLM class oxidoreductase [Murinocardiopsis flavida]PSK99640.1 F420-dependent oxidoreductase-like protein [Murinocardiopsis flavida]